MYYQIVLGNNTYFLLLKNVFLDMTINNPIFIFSLITVIWFIPGILVRRISKLKQIKKKKKKQVDAINKLYPKPKDFQD